MSPIRFRDFAVAFALGQVDLHGRPLEAVTCMCGGETCNVTGLTPTGRVSDEALYRQTAVRAFERSQLFTATGWNEDPEW